MPIFSLVPDQTHEMGMAERDARICSLGEKMRNGHFLLCNYFKTIRDINLKSKAYDQGRLAKFGDDDHDGSRTVGAAQEASEKASKADSAKRAVCPKIFRSIRNFF